MTTRGPVCVTGASGFVAAQVIRELLERGYRVRGTVRGLSAGKYDFLTALPGASDQLELMSAELLTEGSYDAAFAGGNAVIHTASPYVVNVEDPQRDLVDPAVKGKVFTEDDWNEQSSLERNPYYFSKAVAERAAWAFVERERPGFDLVVLNPYLVLGPSLGPELNTTNAIFRDILTGVYPGIMHLAWGFVDVRDAATAHVLALENERARGRYLCAGETLSMKEVVTLLQEKGYGEGYKLPRLDLACSIGDFAVKLLSYTQPTGTGSYMRTHLGKVMRYDNSKIQRDLGLRFRPGRESVLAAVEDLVRWGHLARRH